MGMEVTNRVLLQQQIKIMRDLRFTWWWRFESWKMLAARCSKT